MSRLSLIHLSLLALLQISIHAAERPNVLMIVTDDMNDWISCLGGHEQSITPNLERLAKRGVLFSNAHCQAPICNPSRTSFMTGMRPSSTGIYLNSPWFRNTEKNKSLVTLTQHFQAEGYLTLTTGKIFHASHKDSLSFEVVGPLPGQMNPLDKKIQMTLPSPTRLWDFGPQEYDEDKFNDVVDASWAISRIKEDHDKPFFMALGFYRPHVPFYAPARIHKTLPKESLKLPEVLDTDRDDLSASALALTTLGNPPPHDWFVKSGKWQEAIQAYLACIRFVDEQLGRVLDALDKSPHADNTIILFFSDHGFHLGEKQRWSKVSLWERSTRVPLIISVPEGLQGETCSRPVELLSIYPTLIELCKVAPRPELQGVSLLPLLQRPDAEWSHHAITTLDQSNHAIRTEHWRYIRYADGSEELYDHRKDKHEWNNLAANPEYRDVIDSLKVFLPEENVPQAEGTVPLRKKNTKATSD
jgi:arylsulfatase A-like enzyme